MLKKTKVGPVRELMAEGGMQGQPENMTFRLDPQKFILDEHRSEITLIGVVREPIPFVFSQEMCDWISDRGMERTLDRLADVVADELFKARLVEYLADSLK